MQIKTILAMLVTIRTTYCYLTQGWPATTRHDYSASYDGTKVVDNDFETYHVDEAGIGGAWISI